MSNPTATAATAEPRPSRAELFHAVCDALETITLAAPLSGETGLELRLRMMKLLRDTRSAWDEATE